MDHYDVKMHKEKPMNRILILGSGGSGKSTLARNYSRTMDSRLKRADVIIFLDSPRILCMYRIVKRRLMYHNQTRPDMNEGCPEKLDWTFVKWVWNYKARSRAVTLERLKQTGAHQQVLIVNTRRQVKELLHHFAEC
ncbi:AAA family ATPase [Paenibacillus sp. FSL R7-0204]|uniref:AAA family ATPase n=1 Tax=Paenibacillus sp. FSL R7-0204 TaxID=2921675 RepID=UPI004046ED6D